MRAFQTVPRGMSKGQAGPASTTAPTVGCGADTPTNALTHQMQGGELGVITPQWELSLPQGDNSVPGSFTARERQRSGFLSSKLPQGSCQGNSVFQKIRGLPVFGGYAELLESSPSVPGPSRGWLGSTATASGRTWPHGLSREQVCYKHLLINLLFS